MAMDVVELEHARVHRANVTMLLRHARRNEEAVLMALLVLGKLCGVRVEHVAVV